ncbi:MAG: OmpA family protein [Bdellovibrio sp.]
MKNSLTTRHFIMIMAALCIGWIGCASKPPTYEPISTNLNPTTEIERTEELLRDARNEQVDVLAPKSYAEARKALDRAQSQKEAGKSNEDILENVSYARGWLNEAQSKAEISQTSMKNITAARAGALQAGAPQIISKDWKDAEKELESITSSIEKGSLSPAEKRGPDLTTRYQELEVMAVTRSALGKAYENIEKAKKQEADKKAPKTYGLALMKYQNAEKIIRDNPKNVDVINPAAEAATKESLRLLGIAGQVSAGNSEDLVLIAERQQRTISNLQSEYSNTEKELKVSRQELVQRQNELERNQALVEKAAAVRSQFQPHEAEVYTENGKVMVRLKGLSFAANQAQLGPRNQALLKKVETALNDVNPSRVVIEGHTDATGSPEKNRDLSQKRAQAVEQYLVSKGALAEEQIETVGVGPEKPISDNTTAQGRAQNRRIDLVIETQ